MQYVYLVQLENKCPIKVILCKQVKNMNFVEKIIIKAFKIKFGQPARGYEYFRVKYPKRPTRLEEAKEFFISIFNQRDIITPEYLEYVRWYKLCNQKLGNPPKKGMKFTLWKRLNQLYIQNNSTLNQPIIC